MAEPALVDIDGLAELTDTPVRTLLRWRAADLLPAPVGVGRRLKWTRADIELWIAHRCPPRDEFEVLRAAALHRAFRPGRAVLA